MKELYNCQIFLTVSSMWCWQSSTNLSESSWIFNVYGGGCLVARSCPTLCNPMDYRPPGSFVYEIFWTRIQEWVAISFSKGSSPRRGWTWVSCVAGGFFTNWATREYNKMYDFSQFVNHEVTVSVSSPLTHVPKSISLDGPKIESYLQKCIIPTCRTFKYKYIFNWIISVDSEFKY